MATRCELGAVCVTKCAAHEAGTKSRAAAASVSTALHAAHRDTEDYYLKGRFYSTSPGPKVCLAVDSFSQAMVHDPHTADTCVVVGVRGHLRVWKLPVYNQVMTTVSKHQADAGLIMVFARFIGFLRCRL